MRKTNVNSIKNLRPFKEGKDSRRDHNGRKPKLVSHINKELQDQGFDPVNKGHILDAYCTLLNLPMSRIAAIASSKNVYYKEGDNITFLSEGDAYPILYRLVAKELINDKRGGEFLEKMLDRAIGKPTQPTDVTSKGDKLNGSLSPEQFAILLNTVRERTLSSRSK